MRFSGSDADAVVMDGTQNNHRGGGTRRTIGDG